MSSMVKFLMVTGLVVGAMIATGTVASADSIQDDSTQAYRDAMWYFVPELGRWSTELEQTVEALPLKPELAVKLDELAARGTTFIYDLEGTTPPAEMADAHETLVFAVGQLTEVAQIAASDDAGAHLLMGKYSDRLDDARGEIRVWLMSDIQIGNVGQAPVVSVTGN
jgi:hypothetical protein